MQQLQHITDLELTFHEHSYGVNAGFAYLKAGALFRRKYVKKKEREREKEKKKGFQRGLRLPQSRRLIQTQVRGSS